MSEIIDVQYCYRQRETLEALLDDVTEIIGHGGARGSGKTDLNCTGLLLRRLLYPGTAGVMFRQTQGEVDTNIGRTMRKVIKRFGVPDGYWEWIEGAKEFRFPEGPNGERGIIRLAFCNSKGDALKHLGIEWTDICIEEAALFDPEDIVALMGSNRSTDTRCMAKFLLSLNPGGPATDYIYDTIVNKATRDPRAFFVQAFLRDCKATLVNDKRYYLRLLRQPKWRREQWIGGNWKSRSGLYFVLPEAAVVERAIPYWAEWYGGVDYGKRAPFACLFLATWQDAEGRDHAHFAREVYRTGLELDEQAEAVAEVERELREEKTLNRADIAYFADPSTEADIPSVSANADKAIAQVWASYGFYTIPAKRHLRHTGWNLLQLLLNKGVLTISPTGCPAYLRELRGAIADGAPGPPKSEDIDDSSSDHALDASRYVLKQVYGAGYSTEAANPFDLPEVRSVERVFR